MKKIIWGLNINIILLGFTSFLADVSTEMMLPVIPMFITSLGGTGIAVGLIGGLSDSVASILKVFSGYWSDKSGKRKVFVSSGYLASAVSKIFFPLATSWYHILILKPIERIGKGLRVAPRDAMVAEWSEQGNRGKAFGLHKTMDTLGATLGSFLALIFFWSYNFSYKKIFVLAAVFGFLALIPLLVVKEKEKNPQSTTLIIGLKKLPTSLRWFIIISSIFALGDFSYMFFILKAQESFKDIFSPKTAIAIPILLYILFNLSHSLTALPFGVWSDKIGRKNILFFGYFLFGLTCFGFIFANSIPAFVILFLLYGIAYSMIVGIQRAYVADISPPDIKGISLGTFHTAISIVTLPGSLIAGFFWQYISPASTFLYGAIMGILSAILFLIFSQVSPKKKTLTV
jgi:MFS family permease